MLNLRSRRPVNSIQSIQRKQLENSLQGQKETLDNLRVLVEDMKEIKNLQVEVAANEKEINSLMATVAGLNK